MCFPQLFRLVGWLVGWLAGWLVGWLVGTSKPWAFEVFQNFGSPLPIERKREFHVKVGCCFSYCCWSSCRWFWSCCFFVALAGAAAVLSALVLLLLLVFDNGVVVATPLVPCHGMHAHMHCLVALGVIKICSTSHPGGNQVDGLPPASSFLINF